MIYFVPSVDIGVSIIGIMTILILRDVSALAPSVVLKRAWWTLSGMLAICIALLGVHAASIFRQTPHVSDLVSAGIFLVGVCFIYAVSWLSRRTAQDMSRIERMAQAAYRDALTGIGNRRRFTESLNSAIRDARLHCLPLSLITLDIDHFKSVNDTHGHAVGDEVLKAVAGVIASQLRPTDTACRVGGEEFAVILPQLAPVFGTALAEQIRRAVAALWIEVNDDVEIRVTISLGFAALASGENGPDLLRRADAALYEAKRGGRDRLKLAS